MAHAIMRDGAAVEITGAFTDADGMQHPAAVLSLWTPQQLKALGVYAIVETNVPAGRRSTGWSLHFDADAGTVTRVHATVPVDLDAVKAALKTAIDQQAEVERQRYITRSAGRGTAYQAAEADMTGTMNDAQAQGQAIGTTVEAARLSARAAVDAAEDETNARRVMPAWPAL